MSIAEQKSKKLSPLEFRLFRDLKERVDLKGKRVLIACSGGADSIALALVMSRLAPRLGFGVALAHVHHGLTNDTVVRSARIRAARRVEKLAQQLELEFFVNAPTASSPHSEEDLRKLRRSHLEAWRRERGFDFIAFAHHKDDLLETRLIRLVRGTGAAGLRAMKKSDASTLRPFLEESRATLESYLEERAVKWVKDPTNESTEPLRNWIRKSWLPALEKKRPGAGDALSRSLENIVATLDQIESPLEKFGIHIEENSRWIERKTFQRLGRAEQREGIALFLRSLGVRNFGASHVEEFCKRLDTARKNLTFQLLKLHWEVNAERISIAREIGALVKTR